MYGLGSSPRSRMGVSRSCVGGTVRSVYRVYGGASARTRDVLTASYGHKIVHATSFMCELKAHQVSRSLETLPGVSGAIAR